MPDGDEHAITEAVLRTFSGTPNPRTQQILEALVRHLHAFVRDVDPSEDEWRQGIAFLTRTGSLCTDTRQEFILLSDTLGVTMLVDALSRRHRAGSTENSVLGPFYRENRPTVANGADISGGLSGAPLFFEGHVVTLAGQPIAGALVDVWHADAQGHYDCDVPGREEPAMRALFRTDGTGSFRFRSIMPASYPIPTDGTAGEMLRAGRRPIMRPAHIHVLAEALGYQRLTTTLFVAGDRYLEEDPVFGVKDALVTAFERQEPGLAPDGTRLDQPFYVVRYTFRLTPTPVAAPSSVASGYYAR
jgi:hydroxyquinol 1,2-dioxygenase